jgi:hypothetical protein
MDVNDLASFFQRWLSKAQTLCGNDFGSASEIKLYRLEMKILFLWSQRKEMKKQKKKKKQKHVAHTHTDSNEKHV